MIKVEDLFDVKYGVNLELLNCTEISKEEGGIPFVSRTSKNNGIVSYVEEVDYIEPNPGHTLSVAGGGSVLSTFYQKDPYYSGRDLYVLIPKKELSEIQMLYYAFVIEANKYKYNYGRQANRTLKYISIPDINEIAFNLEEINVSKPAIISQTTKSLNELKLNTENWKAFRYDAIFDIRKGYYNKKPEHIDVGDIKFIGATEYDNGVTDYFTIEEIENTNKSEGGGYDPLEKKIFEGNCITVSNNGSVGCAFYQKEKFTCSHDINPIYLKNRSLNVHIAMFLITLIEQEQYRWNYGRKRRPARMPDSIIKLPVDKNGNPDWDWIEDYSKILFSSLGL